MSNILFSIYRNHSLTYVVKNVSQIIKNKKDVDLSSENIRAFGIDWSINVSNPKFIGNEETCKTIEINLLALGNLDKE